MQKSKIVLAFALIGLLLAACSLAGGGEQAQPPAVQPAATADQSQAAEPTPMPAQPTEADTGNDPAEDEATEGDPAPTDANQDQSASLPDQGPVPTGSSALKATDPDTVNLANGDPTLVEFFAFW